jgi:Skp family chaperone for outer membrane proteins
MAVIDIAKVFKEHVKFKQKMDNIKKEIEAFQADVRQQRERLTERSKKGMEMYKPGSPEYRQLEEELAKTASQIQVNAKLKQKEILDREAKVYYETYQDVVTLVARIARHNGIELVLRFDSEQIDPADRGQVLKAVNRNVIFQHPHLDLTNIVLRQVAPHLFTKTPGGINR